MLGAEHRTYPESLAYHDNVTRRAGERHKDYVKSTYKGFVWRDGGVCGRCGLGRRSEQESQKGRDELEISRHRQDDEARTWTRRLR